MTPSEGWWVLKAQAGDGEALDRLLRGIYPPLLRFVTRMVGDRSAAEDVLQDTMLIIARKLRWLDRPEAFRPWAYRIASRTAMKALRRERRRFLLIDRDADVEAAQAVIAEPPPDLAAAAAGSDRVGVAGQPRRADPAFHGRDAAAGRQRHPRDPARDGQVAAGLRPAPAARAGGPVKFKTAIILFAVFEALIIFSILLGRLLL